MPTFYLQILILLFKICLIATAAWCMRFALDNRNPKGVVLLWRIHFMSLLLVCAGLLFPPLWNLNSQPSIAAKLDNTSSEGDRAAMNFHGFDNPNQTEFRQSTTCQELRSTASAIIPSAIESGELHEPPALQIPMLSERSQGLNSTLFLATNGFADVDDSSIASSTMVPSREIVFPDRA